MEDSRSCRADIQFLWQSRNFPISWNSTVHYHIHNSSPLFPVPSHINPVHVHPSYVFKFYFNVILPTTPGVSRCLLPSVFPIKSLHAFLFPCMPCTLPIHPPWLYGPNNTWWAVQIGKLLLCSSPEPTFYSDNLQHSYVILTRFRRWLAAGRSCPGGGPGGGASR